LTTFIILAHGKLPIIGSSLSRYRPERETDQWKEKITNPVFV